MDSLFRRSSVVEQVAVNHLVAGSNPAVGAYAKRASIGALFLYLFKAVGFEREGLPTGRQGSGNGSFPFGVTEVF